MQAGYCTFFFICHKTFLCVFLFNFVGCCNNTSDEKDPMWFMWVSFFLSQEPDISSGFFFSNALNNHICRQGTNWGAEKSNTQKSNVTNASVRNAFLQKGKNIKPPCMYSIIACIDTCMYSCLVSKRNIKHWRCGRAKRNKHMTDVLLLILRCLHKP